MTAPLTASIVDLLLGLGLGSSDTSTSNRCSLEGVTLGAKDKETIEFGVQKLEATAIRLSLGPLVLEIGRAVVHQLAGRVQTQSGVVRLSAIEAVRAELSGVKLYGPLMASPQIKDVWEVLHADSAAGGVAADAWNLGPLALADGTIRGEITDAHLLFDADVTVPIRQGQIDFNDATVEHVGPDSRMGVSRLGVYVDAPNGRSYVYQFSSAPIAGVEFEQRGALLSPWISERGKLRLQTFAESLLRQARGGQDQGLTQQARLLLDRTALSGEVQLGDGLFGVPGVRAQLEGRSEGRNAVRLHSEAVGRGLTVEMASLQVRDAVARWVGTHLGLDKLAGGLKLQLLVEGSQLRFALHLENCKLEAPRIK